jgi:hypothetical protein
MTNLIPERRVNKNGIMTTKWVLPPSDGSAVNRGIPAPVGIPKNFKIYSPKYGAEVDVADTDFARAYEGSLLRRSNLLGEIDPNVVQTVEYMIQEADGQEYSSLVDSALRIAFNMVSSSMTRGDDDADFTALNNFAVFGGAVMQQGSRSYEVQSLVMGLGQGNRDFLLDATEDERENAVALVTAASRLKPDFVKIEGGGYYSDARTVSIVSGELADFILSRPDDVERITQIVNDRDTDNLDVIRDVLDHSLPALSEGVL